MRRASSRIATTKRGDTPVASRPHAHRRTKSDGSPDKVVGHIYFFT
jgi:hypothetical protein